MADILSLDLTSLVPDTESYELRQTRQQAQSLISEAHSDTSLLPTTLHTLLTQIIKPFFTSTTHPNLTSSGRKVLVPQAPSLPNAGLATDHLSPQPWQNPLTTPLLKGILNTYPHLPTSTRKVAFEEHFYLLVPPILKIIDHHLSTSKIDGYHLLRLLAETSVTANSTIVNRSGLTDVFVDSMRTNFMMLPTLTPEEESLSVLGELYPAYFAVVRARFSELLPREENELATNVEVEARTEYLTLLVRHGVLAGLGHLGAGTATSHVKITTFLVRQLGAVVEEMGLFTVKDLNVILPMMRGILSDPFGLAAVKLLMEALGVLEAVIRVCQERIRERWWGEMLRGVVGCWCNVLDEEDERRLGPKGKRKKEQDLGKLKDMLRHVVSMLGEAVEERDWNEAKRRLVEEEGELKDLFEGS